MCLSGSAGHGGESGGSISSCSDSGGGAVPQQRQRGSTRLVRVRPNGTTPAAVARSLRASAGLGSPGVRGGTCEAQQGAAGTSRRAGSGAQACAAPGAAVQLVSLLDSD
jgi:hypothetical protein